MRTAPAQNRQRPTRPKTSALHPNVPAIACALAGALFLVGAASPAPHAWEPARAGYRFTFPTDFGAHERSRNEWWYYTGNLRDAAGRRFGFEETIFRYGVQHPIPHGTPWDIDDLYFAHFALTDVAGRRFVFFDRTGRAALGDAGAISGDEHEWIGDWSIRRLASGDRELHARADDDALALRLQPRLQPTINGDRGISRKGACATCASHYYSIVRLAATGALRIAGVSYAVHGLGWNDHEWGSDELEPGVAGWDWFSMQLDHGMSVMLYRLRFSNGATVPQSSGTLVDAKGVARALALRDYTIDARGTWTSPHSGARYPSGWRVRIPSEQADLTVTPLLQDQELTTSRSTLVSYWEGACAIAGIIRGRAVHGYGYTELTGYAAGGLQGLGGR